MQKQNLHREIGVSGLSANLINIMVGSGIFVLPAIVATDLGAAGVLAYLFCGVLITLVMLCFAEVGSKVIDSGGIYTYIETSFGRAAGFVCAVLFLLSTITADAAVANAIIDIISTYSSFFDRSFTKVLFFVAVFGGFGTINILGLKTGIGFVKIITLIKIIPLLLIVMVGIGEVEISNLYWSATPSIKEIGKVSLILFFAFQGAESGLSVSGEVTSPKTTIPKSIFVSIVAVLVLYLLIQSIAQGILANDLANAANPLAEVAQQLFGKAGFGLLTIAAAVSMLGYLSSEILSIPRVLYAAGKDGVFPVKTLSQIHPTYATPHIAILVYVGLGFIFANFGGFKQLAIISSATILLIYLGVSLATIKLRMDAPPINSFKIPGGPLIPLLSATTIIWLLSNLSMNEIKVMAVVCVVLTVVYFLLIRMKEGR